MSGRIPSEFIDQLISRVDIVDVIDRRVPLKKRGSEYIACCPFHGEKTPSFTVSPTKQFYHCFGCGEHGTALGFLMEYERLSFPEAVETLAQGLGLEVPHEGGDDGPRKDYGPIYATLEAAQNFYAAQLREHSEREHAVEYLKQRGLSGEIAARFGLGFAPPGWDAVKTALAKQGHADEQIREAGLVSSGDGGRSYDRLRDRVTFPIRDTRGRVIGFGARALGDAEPKYLNSPETPVFHKGRSLYGQYEARRSAGSLGEVLVVEGYLDVIALAQYGIEHVVATLGTACTADHVRLLFRMAPRVVFCFDGDRAGQAAAWKAAQAALPHLTGSRELRILLLPSGEDPDTLVRSIGADGFRQRVAEAQRFSEFFFTQLADGLELESIEGRAQLTERARPLLEQIPAGPLRELLAAELSRRTGTRQRQQPRPQQRRRQVPGLPRMSAVAHALRYLLQQPELAADLGSIDWLPSCSEPGATLLLEMLETLQQMPTLKTAGLLEHYRDRPDIYEALNRLLLDRLPELEGFDLAAEFQGAMSRLESICGRARK